MNRFLILFLTPFIATTANAQDCFPLCDTDQFKSARCETLCDFVFWQSPTIEAVQDILDSGVDIAANDGRGWQAIHYAAMFGSADMVAALLAAGADPNGQYEENAVVSPLLVATYPSQNKFYNSLTLNNPAAYSIIKEYSFDRIPRPALLLEQGLSQEEYDLIQNTRIVEALISAGADVNVVGHQDRTPLHKAIRFENLDVVRLLVDAGADVDAVDYLYLTPLHTTINREHGVEMAAILVEQGADIDATADYRASVLHNAVNSGDFDIVRLLVDAGADLGAKNHNEATPLYDLIKRFEAHDGDTALNLARNETILELAKLMLDAGAPVDAVTRWDVSLFEVVRKNRGDSSEIEELLLEYGASDEISPYEPYCRLRTRRGLEVIDIQIPCE